LELLSVALKGVFPGYDFNAAEYLPFEKSGGFFTILANAFIGSIENIARDLTILWTISIP
jgi:hypothetical protein